MSFIGSTASTHVDNPAIERPIYIENLVRTREHSYRAEAANGLSRTPINAVEECWDQFADIPLDPPPGLTTNGGPIGVVERVAIGLYPISKIKGAFGGWANPSPPPEFQASEPISRVIPANFGNGGYQPTLTLPGVGPTPYDGHSWLIDGLNHYIEFPYGIPENISGPPVLTFYRYTGTTGGGGGGPSGPPGPTGPTGATGQVGPASVSSGAEGLTGTEGPMGVAGLSSLLSKAGVAVGAFEVPTDYTLATTIIDNTQTNTYYPSTRLVPMSVIAPLLSTLEFDVAGTLNMDVLGFIDRLTSVEFGIWVGDVDENTANTNNVLGKITKVVDGSTGQDFAGNPLHWTYKMVATHVAGMTDSLAFRWSGQMMLMNRTRTAVAIASGSGFYAYENVSGLLGQYDDNIPFTLYVANLDAGPGDIMKVTKFNHVFRLVA
jgi:hypothetical protein